jgi:carbon-monoxide dehydrogenase medium subunit
VNGIAAPAAAEPLRFAASPEDALAAIARENRVPLAGGTWLMRAAVRREPGPTRVVALSRLEALRRLSLEADEIRLGAAATHAEIAAFLAAVPACAGLAAAAGAAANPAIRAVATLGGNLCAADFPASDLVPALLAADAAVDVLTSEGERRLGLGPFLEFRRQAAAPWLLLRAVLPREDRLSAHARLPLRKAGDYPVAIVSVSARRTGSGGLHTPRIAVGSVEAEARRWTALEQALAEGAVTADAAAARAEATIDAFAGRDGVEAPGWYRVKVLPSLVRRAFRDLEQQ